jgi:starch synthase
VVDLDLSSAENQNTQLFLALSAPSPIEGLNKSILTWHKIEERNIVGTETKHATEISINFGKFWKCGFYDWRLFMVKDNGRLQPLEMVGKPQPAFPSYRSHSSLYDDDDSIGSIAQGRFVVHAKGTRDHIFHEVQVDF